MEEILSDDTEQCQQNTHFIRNLLDSIINNALGNLQKSSVETKTTCHKNEMSTIVQQFTSDDTLIPIPNDIHTPITESHRTSISVSSIDESFQKLEFKICELNKSVNYELALLNKKLEFFSEYLNKLVNSSLTSQQEKSLEENTSLLKNNLSTKDEIIKKLVETQNTVLNTISAKSNNLVLLYHLTVLTKISSTRIARSTFCKTLFFTTARNIASYSNAPPKTRAKYRNEGYVCGQFTGRYHQTRCL